MGRAPTQLGQPGAIAGELLQCLLETGQILRLHEHSATGAFEHLGVGAAPRRYHRHPAGHRLEQRYPLRVVIDRRHHVQVEGLQERHLVVEIQLPPVANLVGQPPGLDLPLDRLPVGGVLRPQIAGHLDTAPLECAPLAQIAIGIAQQVQPLLRDDPAEIPDREGRRRRRRHRREPVDVHTQRHHAHLGAWYPEIAGHVASVVVADRHERVDVRQVRPDQLLRPGPIRLE